MRLAARELDGLTGRAALVYGAGESARLAATHLGAAGARVTVSARRPEAARALAAELACAWTPWEGRATAARQSELIVLATAALEPVLRPTDLIGGWRPLVVVDLGLPRNAAPEIGALEGVRLFDIDAAGEGVYRDERVRREAVVAAERIVDDGLAEFDEWCERRRARGPVEVAGG
jgi:glutamyl-tRNA reductase